VGTVDHFLGMRLAFSSRRIKEIQNRHTKYSNTIQTKAKEYNKIKQRKKKKVTFFLL
jgi:hypothetical protein